MYIYFGAFNYKDFIDKISKTNLLESFYYIQNRREHKTREVPFANKIFLDSGAFSAWSQERSQLHSRTPHR
jgi:hypothetical protein